MSDEDLKAEFEQIRIENAALKNGCRGWHHHDNQQEGRPLR